MDSWIRAAICLATVLLLAGCADTTAPEVAHLPARPIGASSPAAPGSASTTRAPSAENRGAARPQLRLDDPDSRVAALVGAYRSCLLENGATRASGDDLAPTASAHHVGILIHQPVPAKALTACLHLDPLPPAQLNAATNPRFHAESLAWITCLQKRGIWYMLTDDHDLTATYTPGHAVPDGVDVGAAEQTCTLASFGDR